MEKENHQQTPPPPPPHDVSRETSTVRPRGRPAGSKNKPKPPIVILNDSPNSFRSHFLQIPPGHDIVQTLSDFAVKRQRGICILSATGSVTNVALSQPPPQHLSVLNFTGRFEILSLSGAFLPPPAPPPASGMSVFLSGGEGRVVGGKVAGPLVASEMVVIAVSSFAVTTYERLPDLLEESDKILTTLIPQVNMNPPTTTAGAASLFHRMTEEL
ncbi:unnamed protein product [Rhodiola kirilowii]